MRAERQHGIVSADRARVRAVEILVWLVDSPAFKKHAKPLTEQPTADEEKIASEAARARQRPSSQRLLNECRQLAPLALRLAMWELLFWPGIRDRQTPRGIIEGLTGSRRRAGLISALSAALKCANQLKPPELAAIAGGVRMAAIPAMRRPERHETAFAQLLDALASACDLEGGNLSVRGAERVASLYRAARKALGVFATFPQSVRGGISCRLAGPLAWHNTDLESTVRGMAERDSCVTEIIFGLLAAASDYRSSVEAELSREIGEGTSQGPHVQAGTSHALEGLVTIVAQSCDVSLSADYRDALCGLLGELVGGAMVESLAGNDAVWGAIKLVSSASGRA